MTEEKNNPRLFSGIQPSGNLHLGNYLGMIKNALTLQNEYQSIFCIVDLHAITLPQDPKQLREKSIELAKHYLASGIDPEKSIIFIQSSVSEHSELCWVLNTLTKTAEMERMTQFKDKSAKHKESINVGLFDYPVLMAADILLYDTVVVPVGEDQTQHLEITRTLAKRFNNHFNKEVFTIPEALIKKKEEGSRIMGLDDPTQKMSKSAKSSYNYIALTDPVEIAKKKIMSATTDSGTEIKFDPEQKPGISNLLTIYSILTDTPVEKIVANYQGKNYGDFKKGLAEEIGDFLTDYQEKFNQLDDNELAQILAENGRRAKELAHQKMIQVKEAVGLV